jgi:hypothetical protein
LPSLASPISTLTSSSKKGTFKKPVIDELVNVFCVKPMLSCCSVKLKPRNDFACASS